MLEAAEQARSVVQCWYTLLWTTHCWVASWPCLLLLLPLLFNMYDPFSPEAFLTLDDSLLGEIKRAARRDPQCSHLAAAAAIMRRLDRRDLYVWVAEATLPDQVRLLCNIFPMCCQSRCVFVCTLHVCENTTCSPLFYCC
jgi:hypothetical protein